MPPSELILPPGAGDYARDPESHAIVINETGLLDQDIEAAARTYFVEHASIGGMGRGPSTFGVYNANQGSMLARTEYQTPTNVIEEIKLARELAERDDDIGAVLQMMIALAFGDGMENFHPDERTNEIFNSVATEMNLDRVLRDLYREYLISYQVNTLSLFTRTAIEYTMSGSDRLRSDLISWPYVGVIPAENVRVLDNDMFGTGTLGYVPDNDKLRTWLDEFFNPQTTPAKKAQMGRDDRVAANMFTGVVTVDPFGPEGSDADLVNSDGRIYLLNPRLVHRHTGPKGSWKYPRPLLTRNFALLEAKRLLNLMDFALLQGGANFIVVAKKGSDQRPAQPAELANLKEVVRRASRTGVIVGDHRLTFDVITPELKELLNPEKRKLIGRKLARGLLRLPEMEETGNTETATLDAELIARVITNDRHELKRHVERTTYKEIAKRNPSRITRGAPKLWFPRIILQGSQYFNDLVLKLRDRGDIPRAWAVSAGGFEWEAAVEQRRREVATGTDETMAPAAVPFSSPNAGPQDNSPGRPANGNSPDPAQPRRVVTKTAGETIKAMYSEEMDRGYRIGENTYAILEQHPDYTQGRVSRVERELLDEGAADPVQRATTMYVPVNPEYECADYQAVNLRDGLRMIVGDRTIDRAKVAKLMVFREGEFDEAAAESTCIRWGFPVRMPDAATEVSGSGNFDPDEFGRALADALRQTPAPIINVEVQSNGKRKTVVLRNEDGEIIGSEEEDADADA